jgi:hypothetical protein
MPNWCHNFATLTCPSKEIYDKLLDAIKRNVWFETFAPLGLDPEIYENGWDYYTAIDVWKTKWGATDVQILSADNNDTDDDNDNDTDDNNDNDNDDDNDEETIKEIIDDRKRDLTLELYFETAWSPPTGVYSIMNKNYGLEVTALYDEEGCDFFGRCIYSKEQEFDETYEFPTNKEELEELRKVIGRELDDYLSSTWERLEEEWNEDDEDENDENDEDDEDEDEDDEDEDEDDEDDDEDIPELIEIHSDDSDDEVITPFLI